MNLNKNIIVVFFLFWGVCSHSQTSSLAELENDLVNSFKEYRNADYDDRYDHLRSKLKAQVEAFLNTPASFSAPLDSLSQQINSIISKDRNVRIYSWDELTGGTWHDMAVIVQYKTSSDTIKTVWIDSDIEENPSGITSDIHYKIYDITLNNQPYYMTFGWGTYGSGHHHNSILIFSIEDDGLKVCPSCIDSSYQHIMAPRSQKTDLKYDPLTTVISFNEFILDNEIGFFKPTGERISLKINDGRFEKIKE